MKTLKTFGLSVLLGTCALATASAQGPDGIIPTPSDPPTRGGTRGSNFLHLAIGARGNAMAGAAASSTVGPTAWFWNPAGAATIEGFTVAAGRQNLWGDLGLRQHYVGIAVPSLGGAIGLSVNTMNSGSISRTQEGQPFGAENSGDSFEWNSTAAAVGYARRLTDRLQVGGQVKYVTEGITGASTDWIAFDIGTQFETGIYGLVLAGALQHVGNQGRAGGAAVERNVDRNEFSFQQSRINLFTRLTDLPSTFQFSVGNQILGGPQALFQTGGGMHTLVAEINVTDGVDMATQLALGAEYGWRNIAFLRGGKRFYNDKRDEGSSGASYGLAGGLGLRVPVAQRSLRFDYSYGAFGELQNIQVFSFELGR